MQQDMCTKGPSLPRERPEATAKLTPVNKETKLLTRTKINRYTILLILCIWTWITIRLSIPIPHKHRNVQ